jgi:hypothetical protein
MLGGAARTGDGEAEEDYRILILVEKIFTSSAYSWTICDVPGLQICSPTQMWKPSRARKYFKVSCTAS